MTTVVPKGNCLVARAIPSENPSADHLNDLFGKLALTGVENQRSVNKFESQHTVSPADFRTIQNIRSSALAGKTKTSKFQIGDKLFSDLTPNSKSSKKIEKEKAELKKKEVEKEDKIPMSQKKNAESDGVLLGRGPVHNVRVSTGHHPYNRDVSGPSAYGIAAQTNITDLSAFSGYGGGYECGSTWSLSPDTTIGSISASTTPDTVLSSEGYGSASPPQHSPKDSLQSPFSEISIENSRVLTAENNELPESLQDFILQYSNQYTKEENIRGRPPSADSGVSSPMSARSAPYASPHVPQGTCSSPTTPPSNQTRLSPRSNENATTAKQRLHATIPEADLATGFHWACTTWKNVFSNRDADGDTPLHIVTAHNDLGKIYALCETLRKTMNESDDNVFTVSNNFGETPLYFAVLQRSVQVVEYLLELGSSPNANSSRAAGNSALHFAASRGLISIVKALTSCREIRINITNVAGQTPLLCAVKMHGMMDEHTEQKIDNREIIEKLIKMGADPTIAETSTGKNVVHYAVDKMDVQLLDFLQTVVNEDTFTELANLSDFSGDTAVDLLCSPTEKEDTDNHVRESLYIRLLASGAVGNKSRV
uniref:ANK_REP_REGION domain-containing protein n=2 Tax=Caenorhabditis japonica TaxID=281687 RepID=A0A8R1HV59_CAEJA